MLRSPPNCTRTEMMKEWKAGESYKKRRILILSAALPRLWIRDDGAEKTQ